MGSRSRLGIDALVERTLARARMARDPSAADKDRVLTALRDYLDDPTGCVEQEAVQDEAGGDLALHEDAVSGVRQIVREAAGPTASPLGRWARPWSALPASVQKLVCVGAVTGGLGFWLGSQPDAASNSSPAQPVPSRPAAHEFSNAPTIAKPSEPSVRPLLSPPSALPEVRPSAAPLAPPSGAQPTSVNAPKPVHLARTSAAVPQPRASVPGAASPAVSPAASPAVSPAASPAVPSPSVALGALTAPKSDAVALPAPVGAASPPALGAPSAGDPGFLEAVRLLQRAQRAVESGTPSSALAFLDSLDARFPAALLNEERLATRVLALCATGAAAHAKRVAAELRARNPSSIYAARLAQSCAGPDAPTTPRR